MKKNKRRLYLRISIVVASVLMSSMAAFYFYEIYDPDAPQSYWPVLQAAKTSQKQVDLVVGPNVQVSPTDDTVNYWECVIAANARDPARLVSAVMIPKSQPGAGIVGFYSHDGGATWQKGCHLIAPKGHGFGDPAVAYRPDRTAYLVYMDTVSSGSTDRKTESSLVFLTSFDGGQSWDKRDLITEYVDRPWLVVDGTSKQHQGVVYCIGQVEHRSAEGKVTYAEPIFFHSMDKLQTLSTPAFPHVGRQMINCRPANPVVFADGTLLLAYQDRYLKSRIKEWPRPVIYTVRSTDGGRTFEPSTPVDTKWWHEYIVSSANSVPGVDFPQLAVDASKKKFSNRLYCVWTDGEGKGETYHDGTRVFFSASPDQGMTWSPAVVLSEQPMEAGTDEYYASFVPLIAVNKGGVIAVGWYDRRGLSKTKLIPRGNGSRMSDAVSKGWNFRVRVSLDGGATWTPSIQVNEKPGRGNVNVGHTAGIAAGADGRFHLSWIDNREGKNKLWTSAIVVDLKR